MHTDYDVGISTAFRTDYRINRYHEWDIHLTKRKHEPAATATTALQHLPYNTFKIGIQNTR